jgi:hypothetical protein
MINRQQLALLGRRSFVSQNGLQNILSELKDAGHLECAPSRWTIKRAREANINVPTPYGAMIRQVPFLLSDPMEEISLVYIHPAALLSQLSVCCPPFAEFLGKVKAQHDGSPDHKWHIIVYSDEVLPGNQLKHVNKRKVQTIYWSFKEFGMEALSSQPLWFVLTTIRSNLVERIDGRMSCLFGVLMACWFDKDCCDFFNGGIVIQCHDRCEVMFAEIGCMISDADALKKVFECKGHGGTLNCVCCRTTVAHTSDLEVFDDRLVSSTCTDFSKFCLHTDATVWAAANYMNTAQAGLNATEFEAMQQSTGFNLIPNGILLDKRMTKYFKPISIMMYDWMHIYLVHGIFQNEVGLILANFKPLRIYHTDIDEWCESFNFPARIGDRSATGAAVFKKRSDTATDLQCDASEALSVFLVFQLYLRTQIYHQFGNRIDNICKCYFRLCKVLSMLMRWPLGLYTPEQLGAAIQHHLDGFLLCYGGGPWRPKMHFAMHLANMARKFDGFLISCFVHERKHKEIKRYANKLENTTRYERSILEQVLHKQFEDLNDPGCYPVLDTHLVRPKRATDQMTAQLQAMLNLPMGCPILTAHEAANGMKRVSRNDVATANVGGSVTVVQVWFHADVDGTCVSCVSPWLALSATEFQVQNEPVLILTSDIDDTCCYSIRDGNKALVTAAR